VRVPNAALRFKPSAEMMAQLPGGEADAGRARGRREPSDRRTVWVLRGARPEPVQIQTGVTDGTLTEVIGEGLREDDPVITDTTGSTQKTTVTVPLGAPPPPPGGGRRMF